MTKRPTREDAGRTHDVPPSALPETQCWLDTCRNTGHVVLYASSDKLGGQPTTPRQPVVFCLHHGGEIYDVAHAWKNRSRHLRAPTPQDGSPPPPWPQHDGGQQANHDERHDHRTHRSTHRHHRCRRLRAPLPAIDHTPSPTLQPSTTSPMEGCSASTHIPTDA